MFILEKNKQSKKRLFFFALQMRSFQSPTRFYKQQQFYKQRQAETGRKSSKCQATPWLNFGYLKIIYILHPRCQPKLIVHILINKQKKKYVCKNEDENEK